MFEPRLTETVTHAESSLWEVLSLVMARIPAKPAT